MAEPEKKPRRRIKKVKAHGGHHGGAWKVAYADFVTAMMALFLVLWLVSQADTKLKQQIAQYFRSPGVFDTQRGGILDAPRKVSKETTEMTSKEEDQALSSIAALLKKEFSSRPEFSSVKDQVKIDVTEQGLRIQIVDQADRVSFESGSAAVSPAATAVLAEIARGICQMPNPIQVGGHTDRRHFPAGSTYTNWELSSDRANAARRELEANCVKPEAIQRVVGHADTELLLPEDPYAPANRRISIIMLRVAGQTAEGIDAEKATDQHEDSADHEKAAKPSAGKKSSNGEIEQDSLQHEKKPAADEKSPVDHAPASSEKQLLKAKLSSERSVSVGEADELPSNVVRSRERSTFGARTAPEHR